MSSKTRRIENYIMHKPPAVPEAPPAPESVHIFVVVCSEYVGDGGANRWWVPMVEIAATLEDAERQAKYTRECGYRVYGIAEIAVTWEDPTK